MTSVPEISVVHAPVPAESALGDGSAGPRVGVFVSALAAADGIPRFRSQ